MAKNFMTPNQVANWLEAIQKQLEAIQRLNEEVNGPGMSKEQLADYQVTAADKNGNRTLMRVAVWSFTLALLTPFVFLLVQGANTDSILALLLYPPLQNCLVQFGGNVEGVVRQNQAHMIEIEQLSHYKGQERKNKEKVFSRRNIGGHALALRNFVSIVYAVFFTLIARRALQDGLLPNLTVTVAVAGICIAFFALRASYFMGWPYWQRPLKWYKWLYRKIKHA